jgi:hypothetical protein
MKRGWKIAVYILALIICIQYTTNLVLLLVSILVPSQNDRLIVAIVFVAILLAIVFVGILFSLALFINGFRRMIKLIGEHERDWKIAVYILGLIVWIESIAYFVLSLISRQEYRLIIVIPFQVTFAVNYLYHMIKLIREPAGEKQNEQEQTF